MYEVFEELMKARGMRAVDVSNATGIGQNTLSDWKNGKSIPKADKLQKLANFFGVSMDYLMTGEEGDPTYYYNPETAAIGKEIFENYELHALFDTARDSDPEDLKAIHDMLIVLKRKERKEND